MAEHTIEDDRLTHDFEPMGPETFTSAHELYRELRTKCPVAHSNTFNGFWALLTYEDVTNVLKNHRTYTTSVQNTVPKFAFTGRRPPLHLDPPEHTAYRSVINQFFTKEKMARIEPTVQQNVVEVLEHIVESGEGDIAADYAYRMPPYVFADFFNLTKDLALKIKSVSVAYIKAIQEMKHDIVRELSMQLYDVARDIIAERKVNPLDVNEDLTSALLATEYTGEPLPDELVLGCVRQLIVTGMVAPCVFIGSMFVHLAENPEIQAQLRNDVSLVPAAVEEYLRLFTPYRGMARTPRHDVVIGGREIKQDEPIALVYASANRDETVFPDGDKFILHRPNISQHIAFGLGPHQCPGAPLARMMLRITLEEALRRTSRIELNGEIKMTPWAEWGTVSVPIKVRPA